MATSPPRHAREDLSAELARACGRAWQSSVSLARRGGRTSAHNAGGELPCVRTLAMTLTAAVLAVAVPNFGYVVSANRTEHGMARHDLT